MSTWSEVRLGRSCSFKSKSLNTSFQCKPRTVVKHEKNKCSENILRYHVCSCIIAVERGGVRLDDSVI